MKPIEIELLKRIIEDHIFAEYITQRIDLDDFDDELCNRIYKRVIDFLYQEKPFSYDDLFKCFIDDSQVYDAISQISNYVVGG